jgi:hypothetical protein
MRGQGAINVVSENISTLSPLLDNKRWMHTKKKLCWKCQKDKSPYGGSIKMMGGYVPGAIARFICKDCIDAKQKQLEEANETKNITST